MKEFDFVVLGAGSGGLTAARTAAELGAKVAILEKAEIGGDCLHTGCVPSKSLITIARKLYAQKSLEKFRSSQTQFSTGKIDYGQIRSAVRSRQQVIINDTDNEQSLADSGIVTIRGSFAFKDERTLVSNDGQTVRFKKCVIASGSSPRIPDMQGLDAVDYLTSDTVWGMKDLPKSLGIVGGGPIGLELGQAFAMLGVDVTVFERGDRLVGRFDEHVSVSLQKGLEDSGVQIVFHSEVQSLAKIEHSIKVTYKQAGQSKTLSAERLLLAVGRTPNTEQLGLDVIGIARNKRGGIIVDQKLRTAKKHIYAVGDCLAGPLFTHWAAEQGTNAALHALLRISRSLDANIVPSATFTTPEIGQVGATEQGLRATGTNYTKLEIPYTEIDMAVAEGETGRVTIIINQARRVLGAVVVGHNAAEMVGYFSLLIGKSLKLDELAGPIQPYPTYTIALKQLAGKQRITALRKSWLGRLLFKLTS